MFADTANPWNGLLAVGDQQVTRAGAFTGVSGSGAGSWNDPGWRDARSAGTDPWALPSTGAPGAELSPTGELVVAGLEWMDHRVYDPATRGFLSVDPLEPTTGAAWARNPYSFAGNDPLHAIDPLGLHPVTDAELREYNSNNGIGGFVKNNWEYIAAGAMVVAGGVLMATGVGGPAGMMLVSAGADAIIQKATTGEVNWGQVAVSGAMGAIPFGAVARGASAARTAMMATRAGQAARGTLTAVRSGAKAAGEKLVSKVATTGGKLLGRVKPAPLSGAESSLNGYRLNRHLAQLEKYGSSGAKELESGRIRYYGDVQEAAKPGEMVGRRLVREWDPATDGTRTWHETVDGAGRTRIVRPETGGPKVHHQFGSDGKYEGSW